MSAERKSPKVSIIIVSYNVKPLLMSCIQSLRDFLTVTYEVIVIDNNSSDDTVEALQKAFPDITLIANKHNAGFSAANNQGLELSRGELVLFLNPDTELRDASLNELFEFFNLQSNIKLIAGPKLLNADLSWQESAWKFPGPLQHFFELFFLSSVFRHSSYDEPKTAVSVDFVSGAALLISRSNAVSLGGFDNSLFWMDDVDLCYRNKLSGGNNMIFPESRVVHLSGQSGKKNYNVQISNQIISKLKFYRKHRLIGSFIISVPLFFLQILSRIPIFLVLSPINNTFFKKCRAYLFTLKKFFQYLVVNNQSLT